MLSLIPNIIQNVTQLIGSANQKLCYLSFLNSSLELDQSVVYIVNIDLVICVWEKISSLSHVKIHFGLVDLVKNLNAYRYETISYSLPYNKIFDQIQSICRRHIT